MRRVKQRWDATYPTDPRTAQNLIDNVKRFKKEGWGTPVNISQDEVEKQVQPQTDDTRTSLEWTTEMKIIRHNCPNLLYVTYLHDVLYVCTTSICFLFSQRDHNENKVYF